MINVFCSLGYNPYEIDGDFVTAGGVSDFILRINLETQKMKEDKRNLLGEKILMIFIWKWAAVGRNLIANLAL